MPRVHLTTKFVDAITVAVKTDFWDQYERGLILRVYPRGGKAWYYRYRQQEKYRRHPLGHFPKVSLKKARKVVQTLKAKETGSSDRPSTLAELAGSYFAGDVDPMSISRIREVVLPRLGHLPLEAVTKEKGTAFLDQVYEESSGEEARAARTELHGLYSWGIESGHVHQNPFSGISFAELAELFLSRYAEPRKKSARNDRMVLRNDFVPRLGHLPAAGVTRGHIAEVLDGIVDRCRAKGGTGAFASQARLIVHRVYNWAIARGEVDYNPVQGTEPPVTPRVRERVLTDKELKDLWWALESEAHSIRNAFRLLMTTLQRTAAVLHMHEDQISGDSWTVPGEHMKRRAERRHLPNRVFLGPLSKAVVEESWELGLAGLVLPSPRKRSAPLSPTALSHAARRLWKQLDMAPFTPHDLRRTGSTRLTRAGFDRFVVGVTLGHTLRTGTAMDHYDLYKYESEKRELLTHWDKTLAALLHLK